MQLRRRRKGKGSPTRRRGRVLNGAFWRLEQLDLDAELSCSSAAEIYLPLKLCQDIWFGVGFVFRSARGWKRSHLSTLH